MSTNNDMPDTDNPASAGDASAFYNHGLQHHQAGRLDDARSDYRHALQLQPEHADALHMLGVLAYQIGQFDEALSLISRAGTLLPPNAGVSSNLGNVFQAMGKLEEAEASFRNAIKLAPENTIAHNNLGNALRLQGKTDAAVDSFNRALAIDSGYTDAHVNLAITWQAMGDDARAASSYAQALKLDPGNKPAAHMLAALRGEVTDGAPPEHVEQLFDGYAARFDTHLVDTLGYSMPGELRTEIDRLFGEEVRFPDAIDLGCGTGLTGVEFRDLCDRLVGIDLSPRMIDLARERGVYDDLRIGEIVSALEADQGRYDLLICADVFPYIGKVEPLFSAVCSHARDGALFVFSTELEAEADFSLRLSGRYAHSQQYLRALAKKYNFSVKTMRTENLRKQKGAWIPGDLVVLQL